MTRLLSYTGAVAFAIALTLPAGAASVANEAALKLRIQTTTGAPGQTLTLDLQRWSTDAERAPIVSALSAPPAVEGAGRGPGGRGGAGTPARGSGARAAAPAPSGGQAAIGSQGAADDVPADSNDAPAPTAAGNGTAGRGAAARGAGAAGARGGRGRGAAPNVSPAARLAAAVKAAPTLGYIWGGGVIGYSVKYAWRSSANGPTQRLVLITDRRLDAATAPAAATPAGAPAVPAGASGDAAADFTVIEIRFDPKGTGTGKTSLTTGAIVDQTAGTIAVQNYDAIPLQLRTVP